MSYLTEYIEGLRQKCIGCGRCSEVCPSSKYSKCDPCSIMMNGDGDILNCTGCESCSRVCENTDPTRAIKALNALKYGIHPSQAFREIGRQFPLQDSPSRGIYEPEWDSDGINVMSGCVIECFAPFLKTVSSRALQRLGVRCTELKDNACCLRPIMFSEIPRDEKDRYIEAYTDNAGKNEILALCGGCAEEASDHHATENMIEFLHSHIRDIPRMDTPLKVAVEPGCSLREYGDEMVSIVKALGCEYVGNKRGCCGKNVPVAPLMMRDRQDECSEADAIVVACPMCFIKYDGFEGGKPVLFLSELVAMAFGDGSSLKYHKIRL